ncbi:hypothetical protein V3391_03825 [Luteimonas sp. SMYT11W]|uniref:PepSY domain-containing protein n=1 Tax=Luteimonas flava TaxID=3115822 RepID=A0ABU7WDY5_9GAMM
MMGWSRVDQSAALACRHLRTALLVGALLVCWPALARDDSKISDADANASAEASGRTIYTHYRAIEAVRAAMDADQTMREDDRVAGEITLGYGGQIHVTVLDDASAALYRVAVSTDGVLAAPIEALPAPAGLSSNERAAAQARTTALAFDSPRCGDAYDTVVLPSSVEAQWVVFLIPRPSQGVVRLGGSTRVETEGDVATAWRPYTRSCIDLNPAPNAVAMIVTHLLDPTPTEIHVFWSLWKGKPFYVTTVKNGLWKVEDGRITAVED